MDIENCSFTNNTSGQFGGGLCLGGSGTATCSLRVSGSALVDNVATHGGSQVYMAGTADVSVEDSSLVLNSVGSQV